MRTCTFPVRSLGSALPAVPDASVLSAWIMSRYGQETDLTTWNIETTISDQLPAVEFPAAGGEFYAGRLSDAFTNVREGKFIREFDLDLHNIQTDLGLVNSLKKHCWWSLPSPSALDISDGYFGDVEECKDSLSETICSLCRLMRDAGIRGHILTSKEPEEIELEYFSGKRFLWVVPDDHLETILDVQRDIVVSREGTALLPDLLDSYEIRKVYVRDPDPESLTAVLRHFDPKYVNVCGVAPEKERATYWQELADITVQRDV